MLRWRFPGKGHARSSRGGGEGGNHAPAARARSRPGRLRLRERAMVDLGEGTHLARHGGAGDRPRWRDSRRRQRLRPQLSAGAARLFHRRPAAHDRWRHVLHNEPRRGRAPTCDADAGAAQWGGVGALQITTSLAAADDLLERLRYIILLGSLGAIVLGTLLGVSVTRT